MAAAAVPGVRHVEQELLHVPGAGGAALGAQAAVQAHVLVLHHDACGLQLAGDVEVLRQVLRRSVEASTEVLLFAVLREGDAVHRADVDAGVALDAQLVGEHRLHVAVQAALRFLPRRGDVEAELDFHLHVLQRRLDVGPGHLVAGVDRDVVVVAPLVDAHLLRNQGHPRRGAFRGVFLVEDLVDGDRGVVAVRDRPDDVLRAERRVAAEEDVGDGGLEGDFIENRQAPLVELDAGIALDPGKGVLLPDRDQHVVALEGLVGLAGGHEVAPALVVVDGLHLLEGHPGQLAVRDHEGLGHEVIQDRDAFVLRILFLPGARLHLLEARAHDDFHVLAADALGSAAAVHGGVAAAQDDHALADLGGVAEGHRREPVDADVDVLRPLLPPGNIQISSAGGAGADEDGVVAFGEQRFHAVDFSLLELRAEVEDVADLLVDHLHRQAEARDLGPDHAAGAVVLVEHGDVVAERREVARHGERGGAGADAGDAAPVRFGPG